MNINETLENITMARLENGTMNIKKKLTTFVPSTTTIEPIVKKPLTVQGSLIDNKNPDGATTETAGLSMGQ
jgi:hypothetical protein